MCIAIDARAYNWEGIGRYTRNLVHGLASHKEHKYIILLSPKGLKEFSKDKDLAKASNISTRLVDGSYYSWREQTTFWRQLCQVKADLFHFTHFNIPLLFNSPFVVTIHDITRFVFPGQHQQALQQQMAYEWVFKKAVEKARSIITVSKYTENELKSLPLNITCPISTIYEGVDESFKVDLPNAIRQKARMFIGTTDPYLLFVGVWMSHKNLERILRAYANVADRYPSLKLVITGRPKPGYSSVFELTRQLGIENKVIFPGFVPAPLLPSLYAEAECFVFPSLYEGFGLPALEASACGTPVVTSNLTSLPEIMGDAAIYVNPEYVPSIIDGIEQVLCDANKRQELIHAGKQRIKLFDWNKTAQKHVEVYERAS